MRTLRGTWKCRHFQKLQVVENVRKREPRFSFSCLGNSGTILFRGSLRELLAVYKDLSYAIVSLVESGTSLDGDLEKGARLLVEATGYSACSVYCLGDDGAAFVLMAHFGVGSLKDNPSCVTADDRLLKKLSSGGIVSVETVEPFAGETEAGTEPVNIYPLSSKESLKGFVLLRGSSSDPVKGALLLSAAASILFMVIQYETVMLRNEALFRKAEEAREWLHGVEKFLYLGDTAAMLVHEIKNPIISIGGFAARLKKSIEPGSKASLYMEQMVSEIDRIEKIVDGAFRCMENEYAKLEKENLNSIIAERVELFSDEFNRLGILVTTEFESPSLQVMADREQLKIAFDNLIANAIQSMTDGGRLTISARRNDDNIIVDFKDSGCGIDSAHVGSIFTPFFTTKECGTGLGLPISNSIIRHHKGFIEVLCSGSKGTTFRVGLKGCGC